MATRRKELPSADRYTYRLAWSATDQEFIATVVEFASLSWIADTREAALEGLTSVVEDVLQDMLAEGEEIPAPWDERTFSGKFNLRISPELHERLAIEAQAQGKSINTLAQEALQERVAS
jgi:predicted HicB family RNase H-like nuclease